MSFDLSQRITVNTFGFNVPCRQFIVSAQVTRDKRMPMVDEFVLRSLRICQRIPVTRLAGYFGFTKAEVQSVLADLSARTLVVIEDNEVSLHPSAEEMFRTSSQGVATIMEVEEWVEWLWFDLISQNMIASQGLRQGRNLLELKASKNMIPEQFAREAFHGNFRDYLRLIRRINNTSALSLYAITDVQAGRFGFVPIAGKEELVFEPHPRLRPSILEGYEDRPQKLRLLTDAMTDALQQLSSPEPSAAARADFERLIGNSCLSTATRDSGTLDLRMWLDLEKKNSTTNNASMVGASYVEHNRKSFCAVLDHSANFDAIDDASPVELFWFRPGGNTWGATDDLRAMIGDLRALIRKHSRRDREFVSVLVVPPALRNDRPRRFDRIFTRGVVAPSGIISPSIEILLLRGLGAVVLTSVALTERTVIWIGKATTSVDDLNRIEHRFFQSDDATKFAQLWSMAKILEEEQPKA